MIDFLTKLVILISAVVGLITVIKKNKNTVNINSDSKQKENKNGNSLINYFEPFLITLASYGPMIAILIAIFLMQFLIDPGSFIEEIGLKQEAQGTQKTYLLQDVNTYSKKLSSIQEKMENNNENFWFAYKAASQVENDRKKDKLLKDLSEYFIENNKIEYALISTLNISSERGRDECLKKIVAKSLELNSIELALLSSSKISSSRNKTESNEKVFIKLFNELSSKSKESK